MQVARVVRHFRHALCYWSADGCALMVMRSRGAILVNIITGKMIAGKWSSSAAYANVFTHTGEIFGNTTSFMVENGVN